MSAAKALHRLNREQAQAVEPHENVWLTASAGTGKTQVLSARVLRMLMQPGVKAENILCLTFTKAGAAEMASRIQGTLAGWVRAKGAVLAADLQAIGEDHSPETQDRARTLFAQVIDSPGGGLRVQTIHSFCQTLLSAFPIEARLVPGFRALEEREELQLRREALSSLLVDAERDGRDGLIAKAQALSQRLGEEGATNFIYRCGSYADTLDALAGDIAPRLKHALELPVGDIGEWLAQRCSDEEFDLAALRAVGAAARDWGTKTGLGYAEKVDAWLVASHERRAETIGKLDAMFHTGTGQLRNYFQPDKALGDIFDIVVPLARRVAELAAMPMRVQFIEDLGGALEVGREYARTYDDLKRALGVVDFDDLIARTGELLNQSHVAEWIRFKLDRTIDHILVDEAQDTNVRQWDIVEALAAEYFAGEGAKADVERTQFTVGDFKQAIFGFQGTSPYAFERARRRFAEPAQAAGRDYRNVELNRNYRSTPPVLAFVDTLFARVGPDVLGKIDPVVEHISAFPQGAGQVVLWPAIPARGDAAVDAEESWLDPGQLQLADRIAAQVSDWIANGLEGRPVSPGDIMILVRKRSELASLLVSRLYTHNVSVAGVDRLKLAEPLAVQDLLAAARFAVQPLDDLNLASLLASPLVGWSQNELLEYAYREDGLNLWRHLRQTDAIAEKIEPLRSILRMADLTTPYRFFETILSGDLDGRKKLLRRLGNDALDPIEELLSAALQFEAANTPSLQGFLAWFDVASVDIKRELAGHTDQVRVMTVHGSKGLQSRIVVLADATGDPDNAVRHGFDWTVEQGIRLPVFRAPADVLHGSIAEAADEAAITETEEHWRLLYVAMTRAEEALFVGGVLGRRYGETPPERSWYAAIEATLEDLQCDWHESDGIWSQRRIYSPNAYTGTQTRKADPVAQIARLPEWVRQDAPVEARPPRPLAPSSLGDDDVAERPGTGSDRSAIERGRLIHALFEHLPDIPASERGAAAEGWLELQGGGFSADQRRNMIDTVMNIIDDPDYRHLFGADSLAEAPIAAVLDNGLVVAGQVDRMVVGSDVIDIVDFKTGRAVPESAGDVSQVYVRQMAAYRAAMRKIFPDHQVRAALIYSDAPRIIALPEDLLDAHAPGHMAADQGNGA